MAFCYRWRWRDLLPGGCGEDMIFGGMEDVSGTNGRESTSRGPFDERSFSAISDRSFCRPFDLPNSAFFARTVANRLNGR